MVLCKGEVFDILILEKSTFPNYQSMYVCITLYEYCTKDTVKVEEWKHVKWEKNLEGLWLQQVMTPC